MPVRAAIAVVIRRCEGVLRPDVVLPFDDEDLAGCTVGDVLADPERFEGETLADPLEGVGLWPLLRQDHAPGRRGAVDPFVCPRPHHLQAQARRRQRAQGDGGGGERSRWRRASPRWPPAPISMRSNWKNCASWPRQLSGIGLRAINAMLKSAQQQQAHRERQGCARFPGLAPRQDPRLRIRVPAPDEPWLPQIEVLNEVIGAVVAVTPPSRDIDDDAMRVRQASGPGHARLYRRSDEPRYRRDERGMTKLPPPEQWALCKMNEMEVAEMIEKHIDYYVVDKDGNERSVHLPMPFVRHFMRRSDGALPTVVAYATMPLVLADGDAAGASGLDRMRGIQFIIPDELRAVVPKRAGLHAGGGQGGDDSSCSTNGWSTSPPTMTGKAVIVAAALTMIERSLLRTAVLLLHRRAARRRQDHGDPMLIMAVTGHPAGGVGMVVKRGRAAQGADGHFLYGMPYILWDNIPRGSQISCPHIERSCTSAYYSDRKLGVTEMVRSRRLDHPPLHRQQHRSRRATWPRAA